VKRQLQEAAASIGEAKSAAGSRGEETTAERELEGRE
jgi:hypothetical protein